jgi:antitoxin CptB
MVDIPSDMDDFAARFKRIYFRSQYRGTKELDILLGAFAKEGLASLSPEQLIQYEALLDCNDEARLFKWLNGQEAPPTEYDTPAFHILRDFLLRRHEQS